jgi:protein SCO1/2
LFKNKIIIPILISSVLGLTACSFKDSSFEKAINESIQNGDLNVNAVQDGVNFYSVKNLTPTWEDSKENPIVKIEKFQMLNQNKDKVNEDFFERKITILAFFYFSCPSFCPTLLKSLQKVEKRLSKFNNIQFVAISVDPENDRPSELKKYSKKMKLNEKNWNLLTGNRIDIYKFARETLASELFESFKNAGQIVHSEQFYIFDQEKRLRGTIKGTRNDTPDNIFKLISKLNRK